MDSVVFSIHLDFNFLCWAHWEIQIELNQAYELFRIYYRIRPPNTQNKRFFFFLQMRNDERGKVRNDRERNKGEQEGMK